MDFAGSVTIKAPRDRVFAFLMDPDQVGSCGPGVESVEIVDATRFKARAKVGIGHISTRFAIDLEVVESDPPNRAVIKARGQAPGSAADAVGSMTLVEGDDPDTTVMDWTTNVTVSGLLASVGARLIQGTANKLIARTFDCIRSRIED